MKRPDPFDFLANPSTVVARRLLGSLLTSDVDDQRVTVRLTEVEAYAGAVDPGSHAYRGRRPRNEAMFGPAGHLYVYFTYGMHWCANVVTGEVGEASGVLLRAGEIVDGRDVARGRRPTARRDSELGRGPARLATCLGITGDLYGHDLRQPPVTLLVRRRAVSGISQGPRVGVAGPGGDGRHFPWRFWIADEPSVSVYRPHQPKRKPQTG